VRIMPLLHLLDLIIYLLQWLRAFLQDRDRDIVERNPQPAETSRNAEEKSNPGPDSHPFMFLDLTLDKLPQDDWPKFPQGDWSNWESILGQIRQSAGGTTIQGSGESTKWAGLGDDIDPADQQGGGTRRVGLSERSKTV